MYISCKGMQKNLIMGARESSVVMFVRLLGQFADLYDSLGSYTNLTNAKVKHCGVYSLFLCLRSELHP